VTAEAQVYTGWKLFGVSIGPMAGSRTST